MLLWLSCWGLDDHHLGLIMVDGQAPFSCHLLQHVQCSCQGLQAGCKQYKVICIQQHGQVPYTTSGWSDPLPRNVVGDLETRYATLLAAPQENAGHEIHVHIEQGRGEGAALSHPGVKGDGVRKEAVGPDTRCGALVQILDQGHQFGVHTIRLEHRPQCLAIQRVERLLEIHKTCIHRHCMRRSHLHEAA